MNRPTGAGSLLPQKRDSLGKPSKRFQKPTRRSRVTVLCFLANC